MGEQERKRILKFMIVFSTLFFVIIIRIAHLQFIKGSDLRKDSLNRRLYTQELSASRGEIVDTNGVTIVGNRKSYNVYVVPVEYQEALEEGKANLEEDSKKIAELTGVDQEKVKENLNKENSYYRMIKKDLDKESMEKLKDEKIAGVGIEVGTVRNYTQGSLLANVIGFTGSDNNGLEGLEATYNDELTGKKGLLIVERDRQGNKIPTKQHEYQEAEMGNEITLTVDSEIQHIVEDELKKLAESDINPKSAHVIVQNVQTGEILAMGNYPTFDPSNGGNSDITTRQNGAVSLNYEPGSVFKLITLATGLETGVINKNTTLTDSAGYIQVSGHKIRNWDRKALGTMTLGEAASNSNNVAMVKIGQMIGKENFYNSVINFGFGSKTNINLYGEEQGIVRKPETQSALDYATTNIGQSIMVTPLQLVNAVSAIANGGNLMQPYIVKEIKDESGKIIQQNKPTVLRRVISPETSKTMLEIMRYVVTSGGAKAANIEGFEIGGKTGTAQKVGENGGYAAGKYITSFVGVAPTSNPKYAVLTVVNEPSGTPVYGSTTAAPTASNILKRIMLLNKEVSIEQTSTETSDKEEANEN